MNDTKTATSPMDEAFLDAAVLDALGACGVEESDAFVQTLARSDEGARQTTRDLRDAVARMASASPYMEPPVRLRGNILAATAPQSFKIEQYRRTADTSPRLMRWGLVAAVLFLTAAAWYNGQLQTTIKNQTAQLALMNGDLNKIKTSVAGQEMAMSMMSDPVVQQYPVVVKDKDGKAQVIGKLLVDSRTSQKMLVLPHTVMPPNTQAKLTVGNQEFAANVVGAGPFTSAMVPLSAQFDPSKGMQMQVSGMAFSVPGK